MASRIPLLRILGGLFFVLAGLVYYLGITIASYGALLFIIAGVAVVLLALLGHRARPGDIALFVIGLLVLAAFVSPGIGSATQTAHRITHEASRSALLVQRLDLEASTDVGSINVFYSSRSDIAYQVNFTQSAFPFGIFGGVAPSTSLSNATRGGTFVLNATARSYDISVALGTGYLLNITANAGTGSITVRSLAGERLGNVYLQSGTGSIQANLTSQSIGEVGLQAGTGSVNFYSDHLAPNAPRVPIKLQTGTGSVYVNLKIVKGTNVLVEGSAGLGSVNQNLQGFSVSSQSGSNLVATAGDVSGPTNSCVIRASTGTGSVNLTASFLG